MKIARSRMKTATGNTRARRALPSQKFELGVPPPGGDASISNMLKRSAAWLIICVWPALLLTAQPPTDTKAIQRMPERQTRPRARDLGLMIGILPPGPQNSITDVAGVLVGHTTIIRGDNIRTGVTAILPHNGNLFKEKVPGAVY